MTLETQPLSSILLALHHILYFDQQHLLDSYTQFLLLQHI